MDGVYTRWGRKVGSDQHWRMLKNRLSVLMGSRVEVDKHNAQLMAFLLGERLEDVAYHDGFSGRWYIEVKDMLDGASDPFTLAKMLEATIDNIPEIHASAETIAAVVNGSSCGITLKAVEGKWLSYPTGEKKLDEELVDKPLSFLGGTALDEYTRALDHFTARKWEECSEKVRRTLEEYLRQKLNTTKGLEAAVPELASRLRIATVPQHLTTTLVGTFKTLDKNFNESSKHQSKTFGEKECEFLIYQAGTLMNFLNGVEL